MWGGDCGLLEAMYWFGTFEGGGQELRGNGWEERDDLFKGNMFSEGNSSINEGL